ncbi:PIG-L deacetylase family protein [Streptomyces sp. AJS327]|uniref:PIG-L deacetylase family protein n=1 Tax=Streptomyces sp. AJS327 TaxID=2545265 RepID=UPI0015E00423|nr:PIG-L family deacetylase [Streptomyces sp. AJS327]
MESSLPEIPDHWCPLTLPHLETAADGSHRFLGRPLDLSPLPPLTHPGYGTPLDDGGAPAGRTEPPDGGVQPIPPDPPERGEPGGEGGEATPVPNPRCALPRWDGSRPLGALSARERAAALALRELGVVLLARPLEAADPRTVGSAGAATSGPNDPAPPRRSDAAAGASRRPSRGSGVNGAAPGCDPEPPARRPYVVSPHPDDASLALGGTVFRHSGRVLNVFSEETWTKEPYYAERPWLTSRLLLEEEGAAARVLGAESTGLGFVDAADREAQRDRFFADDPLSDSFAAEEPALFREMTVRLAEELAGARWVCAPLAVGGHIDHVACREAVIALLERGTLDAARVSFYEDQPYALFAGAGEVAAGLSDRLRRLGLGGLRAESQPMDERARFAKQEALRAYRIQVRQGIVRRIGRHDRALARELSDATGPVVPAARRGTTSPDTEQPLYAPELGRPRRADGAGGASGAVAAERLWTRFPDRSRQTETVRTPLG